MIGSIFLVCLGLIGVVVALRAMREGSVVSSSLGGTARTAAATGADTITITPEC